MRMILKMTAASQIPVLLNDDGSIFNEGLADKLAKERKQWTKAEAA